MSRIPTPALILGLAGLIPFLWGALSHAIPSLGAWSGSFIGDRFTGQALLQSYGIVILAFMSGVIWGFAARAEGPMATTGYALSVVPALWAFLLGTGALIPSLIALGGGFIALMWLDWVFWRNSLTPGWWMSLRILLTSVVTLCLIAGVVL